MTSDERVNYGLRDLIRQTPLPDKPVIIATYSRAHTLRYLYWIDNAQTDTHVLVHRERFEGKQLLQLVNVLRHYGYAVLFSTEGITKDEHRWRLAQWTPRELIDIGLFLSHAPQPDRLPNTGQ